MASSLRGRVLAVARRYQSLPQKYRREVWERAIRARVGADVQLSDGAQAEWDLAFANWLDSLYQAAAREVDEGTLAVANELDRVDAAITEAVKRRAEEVASSWVTWAIVGAAGLVLVLSMRSRGDG